MVKSGFALPRIGAFTLGTKHESFFRPFVSSSAVLERISAWSGSNHRGRLFSMKFHNIWLDDQCPVINWYMQQKRSGSGTSFQSIEHRRDTNGTFFHEFILLKLMDGAVCRVERTSDGLRADGAQGPTNSAHDLIQWFSKEDYNAFDLNHPSDLVGFVDLGYEFDILDVLAVCYSVQMTPHIISTPQRYNDYFLCWSIVAVLSRRIVKWKVVVETGQWDSCISQALNNLVEQSSNAWRRFTFLGLCAFLGLEEANPSKHVAEILSSSLSESAGTLVYVNDSLRGTLWQGSWESAFYDGLNEALLSTLGDLLNSFTYRRLNKVQTERSTFINSDVEWAQVLEIITKYLELLDRTEVNELNSRGLRARLQAIGIFTFPKEFFIGGDWLNHPILLESFLSYTGVALRSAVHSLLHGQQAHVVTRHVSHAQVGASSRVTQVTQIQQEYIQPQMHAHAKRVADCQLENELAIYRDLEDTLTQVWRNTPGDFAAQYGFKFTGPGLVREAGASKVTIRSILFA